MFVLNLDKLFKPFKDMQEASFNLFTYPGGEPHIQINSDLSGEDILVTHRLQSFQNMGELLIAVDALKRMKIENLYLCLPYLPGARQDRIANLGEALSIEVYATLINSIEAHKVIIVDPHSNKVREVITNLIEVSQAEIAKEFIKLVKGEITLVCPDKGAQKKIKKVAQAINCPEIIYCDKKRDSVTGKLSGFEVQAEDLTNKNLFLMDDICDGGGTFLGLAKELKKLNPASLTLGVTHGIFSKQNGDNLFEYFNNVFSTNAFRSIEGSQIQQIDLGLVLKSYQEELC